jgi:hypothetical protein
MWAVGLYTETEAVSPSRFPVHISRAVIWAHAQKSDLAVYSSLSGSLCLLYEPYVSGISEKVLGMHPSDRTHPNKLHDHNHCWAIQCHYCSQQVV